MKARDVWREHGALPLPAGMPVLTSPPYARVWFQPPVRMFEYPGRIPALRLFGTEGDPQHVRVGLLGRWGEGHYYELVVERLHVSPRTALHTIDFQDYWTDNLEDVP